MKEIIKTIILGLLIMSCSSQKQKDNNEARFFNKGDTVIVSSNSKIKDKIELQSIELQLYSANLKTTGTVQAIIGQMAEISPPFSGRITNSFVKLGQKVKKGTPLFELNSPEFYEATKNYFQSLLNKDKTEIDYKRQKDLVLNGISSQKDIEEAENIYQNARKEYENVNANLKMFGVNPSDVSMGQPLTVSSPIAGEVVRSNIVLGQYLKEDTEPSMIVADMDNVWVIALVKEKYINSIKENDKVEVYPDAAPDSIIQGKIYHIEEILDEETRSVRVLVECGNQNRLLKPGMFARIHFIDTPKESILIPDEAVFQSDKGSFVFVRTANDEYVVRGIKCISVEDGLSLVTEGLEAGETIIANGGIYLIKR